MQNNRLDITQAIQEYEPPISGASTAKNRPVIISLLYYKNSNTFAFRRLHYLHALSPLRDS